MPHYPERIVGDRLQLRATELTKEAETPPQDSKKEALLQRARRMEDASRVIDRWASSPGLRAPK